MALSPNQLDQIAMAAAEAIESLVECWDGARKAGPDYEIGQIVYAPVPDTVMRHKVAEVVRANPMSHDSAELRFRPVEDASDFRQKPGRLPLAALQLGQTEELLIGKGKQRPCVVVAKSGGVEPTRLPAGEQRNKGQNAFKSIYCLAPLFSCSSGEKTTAFGPVMAARVKCMMYPEFVYIVKKEPAIDCDSVARLDRLFWSHLQCAAKPQNQFLTDAAIGIVWDQLSVLAGKTPSAEYLELRELLLGELPKECH